MPEILADTADDLRRTAALAVTSLPGVARLEPTLTSALRSLQTATAARVSPGTATIYSAADGIRLTRRGNLVDITTTTSQAANITATAVRGALLTTIVAHQLTPGLITVTVLRLARPPAGWTLRSATGTLASSSSCATVRRSVDVTLPMG